MQNARNLANDLWVWRHDCQHDDHDETITWQVTTRLLGLDFSLFPACILGSVAARLLDILPSWPEAEPTISAWFLGAVTAMLLDVLQA